MDNSKRNTVPMVDIKDVPEGLEKYFDRKGHLKLTDEEKPVYDAIVKGCSESGLKASTYQKIWIMREVAEAHNAGPKRERELVTEQEKLEFIMEKVKWEMRKLRRMNNGSPFKDWMDLERKAREVLNKFGQGLPAEVSAEYLTLIMAMFSLGMLSWGKWEKSS